MAGFHCLYGADLKPCIWKIGIDLVIVLHVVCIHHTPNVTQTIDHHFLFKAGKPEFQMISQLPRRNEQIPFFFKF